MQLCSIADSTVSQGHHEPPRSRERHRRGTRSRCPDRDRRALDRGRLRHLRRRAVVGRSFRGLACLARGPRLQATRRRDPGRAGCARPLRLRGALLGRRRRGKGGFGCGRGQPCVADKSGRVLGTRRRRRHGMAHVAGDGVTHRHRMGDGHAGAAPLQHRFTERRRSDGIATLAVVNVDLRVCWPKCPRGSWFREERDARGSCGRSYPSSLSGVGAAPAFVYVALRYHRRVSSCLPPRTHW